MTQIQKHIKITTIKSFAFTDLLQTNNCYKRVAATKLYPKKNKKKLYVNYSVNGGGGLLNFRHYDELCKKVKYSLLA